MARTYATVAVDDLVDRLRRAADPNSSTPTGELWNLCEEAAERIEGMSELSPELSALNQCVTAFNRVPSSSWPRMLTYLTNRFWRREEEKNGTDPKTTSEQGAKTEGQEQEA